MHKQGHKNKNVLSFTVNIKQSKIDSDDEYYEEDLEDTYNIEEAKKILFYLAIPFEEIKFPEANSILVYGDNVWDNSFIYNRLEWVYNIPDMNLNEYVMLPEEDFWDSVSDKSLVYHATSEENADQIENNGIEPRCETRGISNKYMPCAVFTSENIGDVEPYGNVVFEINLGHMKRDGYMPKISGEDPLDEARQRSALANMIGVDHDFSEEYSSEGLLESTIVIFGEVPAKYLKKIKQ